MQEALEAGSCLASVSKCTVPDPQGGTLFGISYLLLTIKFLLSSAEAPKNAT